MSKHSTRRNGDIVCIDLGEGWLGFGRTLASVWAFYDFRTQVDVTAEEVLKQRA
jgi:hypothetical protein